MRRTFIIIAALLALALAGCSLASEPVPAGPVQRGPLPGEQAPAPQIAPVAAVGEQVYADRCAACHGDTGDGDSVMAEQLADQGAQLPDFTDPLTLRGKTPQEYFAVITNGTIQSGGLMPPWSQSLSESERWSVAYYMYSLSLSEDDLARGEELYTDELAECLAEIENLEEVDTDLSPQLIEARYLNDCDAAAELTDSDRWAVMIYALSFPVDGETTVADTGGETTTEGGAALPEGHPPIADEGETGGETATEGETAETPGDDEVITEDGGIVSGVVALGDTPAPEGTEVTLRAVTIGMEGELVDLYEATALTDADGVYTFDELPLGQPGLAFLVEASYNDMDFSNATMVEQGVAEFDLPIDLYETTSDSSALATPMMHVIIEEADGGIFITQFYVFQNTGDAVIVQGETSGTVDIALADDAVGVEFFEGAMGDRYVREGNIIHDTQMIYPGEHQVAVRYFLEGKNIEIPILHNVDSMNVMAPEGINVRSSMLSEGSVRQTQAGPMQLFAAGSLSAGDTLTMRAGAASSIALGDIIPVVLAVIAAGILGYVGWTYQQKQPQPGVATTNSSPIVRQLAELDKAYEEGRINRIEYESKRAQIKLQAQS